jgi:predicted phosphoribosyltransferase
MTEIQSQRVDETRRDTVDLTDPEVTTGIAMLVSTGLLTQARADQILAGTPPTS